MLPVFALALDEDVDRETLMLYPQLYRELQQGRSLSLKTLLTWILLSLFQAGVILLLSLALFSTSMPFLHLKAITFTCLTLSQLLNALFEIKWQKTMFLSVVLSLAVYVLSVFFLRDELSASFVFSREFAWKVSVITSASVIPPMFVSYCHKKLRPPVYAKVSE